MKPTRRVLVATDNSDSAYRAVDILEARSREILWRAKEQAELIGVARFKRFPGWQHQR